MLRQLIWVTLLLGYYQQISANDNWITGSLISYHPIFYANTVYLYKAQPQRGFSMIDSAKVEESGQFFFKKPFHVSKQICSTWVSRMVNY
jgi:hypothetical protein